MNNFTSSNSVYFLFSYTLCIFVIMLKKRINITIDPDLHEKCRFWAIQEGKSLSEVIEGLLQGYRDSKSVLQVCEPQEGYGVQKGISLELSQAISKLPPERQTQVLDFVEFLMSKQEVSSAASLLGLFKGDVEVSDDFDAPLEAFKSYMP